jgi:hypothetical protein
MNRVIIATAALVCVISVARAQEARVKLGYAACRTEVDFEKFNDLRRSGDDEAFKTYLLGSVMAGTCILLTVGDRVYKEGVGHGDSIIKIRRKGQVESYFTYEKIVE